MSTLAIAFLLVLIHRTNSEVCLADKDNPACRCMNSDGKPIDLRSIGNSDGEHSGPRFDKITGGGFKYSYNPCYPFTEGGGTCYNAAACQFSGDGNTVYSLGTQEKASFEYQNSNLYIKYSGGTDDRTSEVKLQCNETANKPELKFDTESPQKNYKFILASRCNCPGLCSGSSHKSKGMDPGIVGIAILSVFVVAIVVYFVVGMIIMKVKFEKTGTDIIPNKTFWSSLPFLVKDGVVFTFTPCINCVRRDKQGYSTMDKS